MSTKVIIAIIIVVLLISVVYSFFTTHDQHERMSDAVANLPAESVKYRPLKPYYRIDASYDNVKDSSLFALLSVDAVDKAAKTSVSMEHLADTIGAVAFDSNGNFYSKIPRSMPTALPLGKRNTIMRIKDIEKQQHNTFRAEPGRIEVAYAAMNKNNPVPEEHRDMATMTAIAASTPDCVAFDNYGNLYNVVSPYYERKPLPEATMFVRADVEPMRQLAPAFGYGVAAHGAEANSLGPHEDVVWKAASDPSKLAAHVNKTMATIPKMDPALPADHTMVPLPQNEGIVYVPVVPRSMRPLLKGHGNDQYRTVAYGIDADNVWGSRVKGNTNDGTLWALPSDGNKWKHARNAAMGCESGNIWIGNDRRWASPESSMGIGTPVYRSGGCQLYTRVGSGFDKKLTSAAPITVRAPGLM